MFVRLVECLAEWCEEDLKDIWLPTKPLEDELDDEELEEGDERRLPYRAIRAYKHAFPAAVDPSSRIPYLIVQATGGEDTKSGQSGLRKSIVDIRLVLATYDENTIEGKRSVLNIISKLRDDLWRMEVVGCYEITEPFQFQVLTDDTGSYHIGEILTTWKVPRIERDIPFLRP